MAQQTTFVMVPPLFLIFLVLGTIFIGVATPTEGGAMGAIGALILGAVKRRLTWDLVRQAVESTAKLSAFVVFILVGARVFSLTFYGVGGHIWVEHLLTSLPGGQIGFLIFVNAFVFVLAFFLDFFELAFIIIPLLGPAAEKLGIDLIWFGVMLGVNMQTSFMHPPFGFALFYLRSVAPREPFIDRVTGKRTDGVTTGQIYWGAVPFVVIQVIMVLLVILFPAMVMHYKGAASTVDPDKVKIEIPQIDLPPLDFDPPNSNSAPSPQKKPRSLRSGVVRRFELDQPRDRADHELSRRRARRPGTTDSRSLREGHHRVVDLLEDWRSPWRSRRAVPCAALKQASMICGENPCSLAPPASSLRSAAGLSSSYFAIIQVLAKCASLLEDRLIVLRQRVPLVEIDEGEQHRAAFPPARIVVVRRDLVEAELLVVVGADPFGGVDGALLQRRIDVAAGDLLRHDAELLQHACRRSRRCASSGP